MTKRDHKVQIESLKADLQEIYDNPDQHSDILQQAKGGKFENLEPQKLRITKNNPMYQPFNARSFGRIFNEIKQSIGES